MLASTITPLPQGVAGKGKRGGGAMGPDAADDAANLTFGGILVRALIAGQSEQALEASCRVDSVLSHLLTGNSAAKERVLRIPLQIPTSAIAPPELLMPLPFSPLSLLSLPPPPSQHLGPILSHLLTANSAAKERVLRIPLQIPTSALAPPELLMPRIMRYLAAAAAPPSPPLPTSSHPHSHHQSPSSHSLYSSFASSFSSFSSSPSSSSSSSSPSAVWLQPVLLRLLLTWLSDCPPAVAAFLAPPGHLPFLVGLVSAASSAATAAALPGGGAGEDVEDQGGSGGGGGYGDGYSDGYDAAGDRKRSGGGVGGEVDGRGADETAGTAGAGAGGAGGVAVHVGGLASLVLGACVVYNDSTGPTDAATVVDIITQRIGLAAFFARIEDLKRDPYFLAGGAGSRPPKPLTRSTAAAEAAAGGTGGGTGRDGGAGGRGSSSGGKGSEITEEGGPGNSASASAAAGLAIAASRVPPVSSASSLDFEPPIASFYDREFVRSVLVLEEAVRLRVVQLFSMPRGGGGEGEGGGGGAVDVNRKEGESEGEYAGRLRAMLQSQHQELQHLRSRNVALAKDAMQLAPQSPSSGAGASDQSQVATSADGAGSAPTHAELEAARRQLAEAEASVATLRGEQETLMGELMQVRQVAAGKEADLQALSMAYHSLEQENLRLEGEVKTLQSTTETLRASLASAEAAAAAAGLGGATGAGAGSGMPEAEVEERVEAARQEAREEAQRESETELNDLLVCLGQEEKK
ncbi:unnamed protein product, partial [Closterium sp. NIES-54]